MGNDILGFDSLGQVVNKPDKSGHGTLDWVNICQKSAKVLIIIGSFVNQITILMLTRYIKCDSWQLGCSLKQKLFSLFHGTPLLRLGK